MIQIMVIAQQPEKKNEIKSNDKKRENQSSNMNNWKGKRNTFHGSSHVKVPHTDQNSALNGHEQMKNMTFKDTHTQSRLSMW